jgi:hypothetical protein
VFGLDDADPPYFEAEGASERPCVTGDEGQEAQETGCPCVSEVDPALFAPPQYERRPEPIHHEFSTRNRPISQRRRIRVRQVFPGIDLWKNKFDTFNELQSEIANTLAYRCESFLESTANTRQIQRHFRLSNEIYPFCVTAMTI